MNGARFSYLGRVCELAMNNKDIIVVSADYAAPVFDKFKVDYAPQYVSVGIAEQNLIAVASGLALNGKRPVAYGLSPFPITRTFDQLRSAVANMELPVTIAVSGAGFSEGGITHSNIEDIALIRTLPCVRIITPTDNIMGSFVADYALTYNKPLYVRFDKCNEGELYKDKIIDFQRGFEVLRDGNDIAVVTCGWFTLKILKLAEQWANDGINARVIDLYSLPYDETALLNAIGDLPLVTVEEHVLQGGIGSALLETMNEHNVQKHITRMGINFNGAYPHLSGSRDYFLGLYGLTDEKITKTIISITAKKGGTECS